MRQMKRKVTALLLLLALLLCGCAGKTEENVGNEKTVPLDRILEALKTGSVATYESAFPSDFCRAYREAYPDMPETVEALLNAANGFNREHYGEDYTIRYELTETELCDPAQFAGEYQFNHLDTFSCTVPLASEAARIHVTVYHTGSFDELEKEEIYTVLLINGIWYFHPQLFGTVLHD